MGDVPICTFRITHPTVSADAIMRAVGMHARFAWTVGEPRVGLDGRPMKGLQKDSYCAIPVPLESADTAVAEVEVFLQKLVSLRTELLRLRSSGGTFAIYISWTCGAPRGLEFGAALLATMGELGIELWLEAHSPSNRTTDV